VIDALCDELPSLVSEAMHPSHVSLRLRPELPPRGSETQEEEKSLALAEEAGTVVVTADHKLLETQGDPPTSTSVIPWSTGGNLVSGAR
jgi:hypothetical protein